MKRHLHFGLTNIMFWLSGIFITVLIIGMLSAPFITRKMKDNTYSFSDRADIQLFEKALDDKDIPYNILSDTTISIPADWKDAGEEVYSESFDY